MERRLAAILAADVVGYSRLMEADEAGTHEAIKALRSDLIDPLIAEHRGRIVKLMGDGALVEFASVVDAVACAIDIQRELIEQNADAPKDRRIELRIGINLGDVIVEGDDIYGEGVNVASRLEGIAEPGGVCISEKVYQEVEKKLDLEFTHLGELRVKNIEKPVRTYAAVLGDKRPVAPKTSKSRLITQGQLFAAAVIAIALIGSGVIAWLKPWAPEVEPASVERMAFPLPEKPSIAVLPFVNLSGDPQQEYFSDGMTEDIITALSRFPDLFVIARTSVFTYKGKPVKVQQVSEELGVRYVLEGSVQRSGDRVRITAQLIDATSGRHLWGERLDRELKDIFALQDEVVQTIVARLTGGAGRLTVAERARVMRKSTDSLEAYELALRARQARVRFTKEGNAEALRLNQRAVQLDPEYARAHAGLAGVHLFDAILGWSDSPAESINRAFEFAKKAVALDDSDYMGHWYLGRALIAKKEFDQGLAEYEKAMTLNPNEADLMAHKGLALTWVGRPEEAIAWVKKAMRLNPYYGGWYPGALGFAYYMARQYEEAIAPLTEAINRNPKALWMRTHLAASYAQLGRDEEAREAAAGILEINPEFSINRWGRGFGLSFKNPADVEHHLDGLRKAGLPERAVLPLPDKPSIAVLPFANMSDDPAQEYFADGMAEDIITDLSKISGLFVIARNSSFSYKGQSVKVRQAAQELGVRYVLEGSVRRAGDTVRINAQLIDATTGGHVWADRYDGSLADIFALQDNVTAEIVRALAVELSPSEELKVKARGTASLDAYDAYLLGLRHLNALDRWRPDETRKARNAFEKAIAIDPKFGPAHAGLAWTLWFQAVFTHEIEFHRLDQKKKALEMAAMSLDLSDNPLAHRLLARQYLDMGDIEPNPARLSDVPRHDEAVTELRKAVALEPNDADSLAELAYYLVYAGNPDEAATLVRDAKRLNPNFPIWYHRPAGIAEYLSGRYEAAEEEFKPWFENDVIPFHSALWLAAAQAQTGNNSEAKAALQAALVGERKYTTTSSVTYFFPFKNQEHLYSLVGGLRKAGLPDAE
jgi:TolB-like protein/class 3 adenylate cyclase/predicted Zn-dependent protease